MGASAPPAAATSAALALTVEPIGAGDFLEMHWERAPLIVPRSEPGRFDSILAVADVERLVCETGLRMPGFRLVKDGAPVPAATYTESIPWRPSVFSATAVVDSVARAFAEGATVVLQGLHIHWHPAACYCRGLERELGCPAQANAYFTPAGAQGFAVHHDTHDVFILQVAGRKRWRIYEPVLELPLNSQRWSAALGDPGQPVVDVVLEAGDTVYLPRGWPHEAATADSESLHLTIGVHPPTRLDALRAALDRCAGDVEFRRSVPATGELPAHLLDRLAAQLRPELVARSTRRRFVSGRRPILDGQLAQVRALDGLTAGDLVERRPTVIAELDVTDSGATLLFEGKEVVLPVHAAGAVQAAHNASAPFTAADLPGTLDEPGRLVLIRRLVREGYLRVVAP